MLSVSKFLLDGLQLHLGWLDGAEVLSNLSLRETPTLAQRIGWIVCCGLPRLRSIIDRDPETGERLLNCPLPESVMDYPKFVEEFYVELRERSRSWCENQVFFKGLPTIAVKDEVHREFVF